MLLACVPRTESRGLEAAPVFADMKNPLQSSAGYYTITWKDTAPAADKQVYELAESSRADARSFRVVYRGGDRATTLSGRSGGDYHYRIRAKGGTFAPGVLTVRVRHHSLTQAFAFLAAGALVFLCTVILIFMGARRASREGEESIA